MQYLLLLSLLFPLFPEDATIAPSRPVSPLAALPPSPVARKILPEDKGNISAGKDPSLVGWTYHPCETETGRATRACDGTKALPEKFPVHQEMVVQASVVQAPVVQAPIRKKSRIPSPIAATPPPPRIAPPPVPPLPSRPALPPRPPQRAAWDFTPSEKLQWQQELAKGELRRLKRELEEENAREGTVVLH